jgi:hypothetical protein
MNQKQVQVNMGSKRNMEILGHVSDHQLLKDTIP